MDTLTETKEMVTIFEAQILLSVSRQTIMQWRNTGKFPGAMKTTDKKSEWRIPRADIEAVRQDLIDGLQRQIDELRRLAL